MIEAILPLKIRSYGGDSDLERFSTLLLPSLDRFFLGKTGLKMSLIVPESDLLTVGSHIQKLARYDIEVLCEDQICPSLKGYSGWHKQQILKLAAAKFVVSNYYLVLDADVILKRPLETRDIFCFGRPIFERRKASAHWDWWEGSRRILKSNVRLDADSMVMDVTPEFLHRETCLDLQQVIASRNRAEEWDRFLFDTRRVGWTEYSLYWLYVLERGLDHELYDWSSARRLYEGIWGQENLLKLSPGHLQRLFAPDSDAFFLVIQSNLSLEPAYIRDLIRPFLGSPALPPSLQCT